MTRSYRRLPSVAALALGVTLASCAATPAPRVLNQVDTTREAPASREAAQFAPQAHAHAEQIRERAHTALASGDRAGAQILGEQALAAYYRAALLARVVKAEQELTRAKQRLAKAQTELDGIEQQQRRLSAEADDFELRVKIARDAEPIAKAGPGTPERERARREAALALGSQARLLCAAARLLDADRPKLGEVLQQLDAFEKALARRAEPVAIDQAVRLRSACLRELTELRRKSEATDTSAADALLSELGNAGNLFPFRDDRGVVVTLRGAFRDGDLLSNAAEQQLALLGRVAKAHERFPVMVVVHSGSKGAGNEQRRADVVAAALRQAGARVVETKAVGAALPVADPQRPGASERNERIEIVFVSPS